MSSESAQNIQKTFQSNSLKPSPYLFVSAPAQSGYTQGRTIVVGDIHGCMDEFNRLLAETDYISNQDLLISVGDFMDRGPDSWEAARFFRSTPGAYAVCGNHERRIAGTVRRTSEPAWTQKQTLQQMPKNEHRDWADWLASLPAVIETDEIIVTHARLDPEKLIDSQDLYHTAGVGGPAARIILDDQGVPDWYWKWEEQSCLKKPVCIGHLQYGSVELVKGKLYAIDTGAASGGKLTALILPEKEIVSVASRKNYFFAAREAWKESQWKPVEEMPLKKVCAMQDPDDTIAESFTKYIEGHQIERRLKKLHEQSVPAFGAIPPPGPERRTFYKELRAELPKPVIQLAEYLLRTESADLKSVIRYYKNSTLSSLNHMVSELERITAARITDPQDH